VIPPGFAGTSCDYTAKRVLTATGNRRFEDGDGDGCMTFKKLAGVTKAKFEWDSINRLTAIEIPGLSRSEFAYDVYHRRYKTQDDRDNPLRRRLDHRNRQLPTTTLPTACAPRNTPAAASTP